MIDSNLQMSPLQNSETYKPPANSEDSCHEEMILNSECLYCYGGLGRSPRYLSYQSRTRAHDPSMEGNEDSGIIQSGS